MSRNWQYRAAVVAAAAVVLLTVVPHPAVAADSTCGGKSAWEELFKEKDSCAKPLPTPSAPAAALPSLDAFNSGKKNTPPAATKAKRLAPPKKR